MALIHRLPETLVNQIAAGEVVERPASVVKELCENALDAGARNIEVTLEEGGTRLIEVKDDGSGMSPEDALLSLERHATSKLREEAQLQSISTLGFRGEALPAIASVSHFTLTTRTPGALAATRLTVDGGAEPKLEEVGAPEGTRISVADLFFNTPARRKFLKKPQTEAGQVAEVVTRLVLSRPEVGFALVSNGRRTLAVTASAPLKDRVALALGRETFELLVPIDDTRGAMRVTGYAGAPDVSAATSQKIQLFVNGRAVRDRSLQHAVTRAYANLLPPGRFPVAVIFVSVPLDQVDVNVHPQKSEVRFAEPRAVYEAVASAIGTALRPAPWLGPGRVEGPASSVSQRFTPEDWGRSALAREPVPVWDGPPASAPTAPDLFTEVVEPKGYFSSLRFSASSRRPIRCARGRIAPWWCSTSTPPTSGCASRSCARRGGARPSRPSGSSSPRSSSSRRRWPRGSPITASSSTPWGSRSSRSAATACRSRRCRRCSRGRSSCPCSPTSPSSSLIPGPRMGAGRGERRARHHGLPRGHPGGRRGDFRAEAEALFKRLDQIDFKVRCPHGRPVVTALSLAELERRVERR